MQKRPDPAGEAAAKPQRAMSACTVRALVRYGAGNPRSRAWPISTGGKFFLRGWSFGMRFGSFFTGVGCFDTAMERCALKCIWQVEKDKNCLDVLARRFTKVRRIDDIVKAKAICEPRNRGR